MGDSIAWHTIKVDTDAYRQGHGVEPGGWRAWRFEVRGLVLSVGFCSYEDALRDARQAAHRRGVKCVKVLP
jgi:hypothetical protein